MTSSNIPSLHFAANLKLLRKMKGLTQQGLADVLEIKRSAISTYESGFTEPRLLMLQKMATFFEVSLEQLISSDPEDTGIDQIIVEDTPTKDLGPFLDHLKDFLNATTEAQKMYDGLLEFDKLNEKNNGNSVQDFEAQRLKLILQEILNNNWSILKEIQMQDQ